MLSLGSIAERLLRIVKSELSLSILVYLLGWSLSFLRLLFLYLLFISPCSCFHFLVASSFSLPVFSFSFLGTCRPVQHGQYSVLVMRLSACSPFGFAALFCVAWVGADASVLSI